MWNRLREQADPGARPPVVVTVPDPRFGPTIITAQWHPRVVSVRGPWRRTLVLEARPELSEPLARVLNRAVPPPRISAAERDGIRLTADGVELPLDIGRRALRRSTYDVRATVEGRRYHLEHTGRGTARLHRDGAPVGELTSPDAGQLARWSAHADAVDATVAATFATTLGVGARGVIGNLLQEISPF